MELTVKASKSQSVNTDKRVIEYEEGLYECLHYSGLSSYAGKHFLVLYTEMDPYESRPKDAIAIMMEDLNYIKSKDGRITLRRLSPEEVLTISNSK